MKGVPTPATDGVDARARLLAARLLAARARRGGTRRIKRPRTRRREVAARHRTGPKSAQPVSLSRALQALERDGWRVLSQVPAPGRGGGTIEQVLIGPGGVLLIDSRYWVGRIEITRGVVQQNGFWREQECSALAQVAGSVAALLPARHRTAVHAVICVTQHPLAEHVVAPGVRVVGVSDLERALRLLPPRLDPDQVAEVFTLLARTLMESGPFDQLTTAELDGALALGRLPGAHRMLSDPPPPIPLFVPVEGTLLRNAARLAGPLEDRRGRRLLRWWTARPQPLDLRLTAIRALLVLTVVLVAAVWGPGMIRGLSQGSLLQAPVPVTSVQPRPGASATTTPAPAPTGSRAGPLVENAPWTPSGVQGSNSPAGTTVVGARS